MRRSGLALLLAVGVLGILGILGAAFVTLARLERRASLQRLFASQAVLLARSGLEDAAARVRAGQPTSYGGEDWDGDGVLSGFEALQEAFQQGKLNVADCPVGEALRPSFFADDGAGTPKYASLDGRARARSGELATGGFALRVETGGIHVNDTNSQLRRILGVLAEALGREEGAPLGEADGWKLVDARPAEGWTSFGQISAALGPLKASALRPYLALTGCPDPKVLKACATAALAGRTYTSRADLLRDRGVPALEARTPVDLAWARRHRPVLLALLASLEGLYLDEFSATCLKHGDFLGTLRPVTLSLTWSSDDDCHQIAERLLVTTSDLSTWGRFDAFCDSLDVTDANAWGADDELPWVRQAKRDLVKANFNSNSALNKFNPDAARFRLVDKSDLVIHSTEFDLLPKGGGRISSAGRVVDGRGQLLAERTLSAELPADPSFTLTTQAEFVAGDLGRPEAAGDETAFRSYGDSAYVSKAQGAGRCFGHKPFGGRGMALQTWPEPHTVAVPASWDGSLGLATVETADGEGGPTMKFLARWDQTLAAAYSPSGSVALQADVLQAPAANSLWDPALPGTLHPDGIYSEKGREPGFLAAGNLPPSWGALSYWFKASYDPAQWKAGSGGILQRHRMHLNGTRLSSIAGIQSGLFYAPTHMATCMFVLAHVGRLVGGPTWDWPARGITMVYESDYGVDEGREQQASTPQDGGLPLARGTWHLMTLHWDAHVQILQEDLRFAVDRGILPHQASQQFPSYGVIPVGSTPFDATAPDASGPAVLWLGRGRHSTYDGNATNFPACGAEFHHFGSADVTFDEFAVYDFGSGTTAPWAKASVLAQDRFEVGRFYRESAYTGLGASAGMNRAGEYFTAPVDLGDVELRTLAWTQTVPRGLRSPAGALPEDGDPGPDGAVVLELADAAGTFYLADASGTSIQTRFSLDAGHPVGRRILKPFRLHAIFQPNLEDPASTPVLDPLVLDDLTVVYRLPGGPSFRAFREGE